MGDTTYAANDTALSDTLRLVGLLPGDAELPSARGQGRLLQRRRAGAKAPHRHVDADAAGSWHPALWISTECSAARVLLRRRERLDDVHQPADGRLDERRDERRTVYLTVDSEQDSGAFSLATSFTDGPAAPANDTCAGVIALDLTSGLASVAAGPPRAPATTSTRARRPGRRACKDTSAYYNGADVVYSAVVPAGKRLSVTAFPSGQFNPALWISETCANPEPTCLAARDGDGTRENVVWTNTGTADKPVMIHVDAQDPVGGAFSLSASLGAPKACPTTTRDPAVAYVSRTNNAGNDFIFTSANVSAVCATPVTSPLIGDDDITAFDVPAGKTLSITIKSTITHQRRAGRQVGRPADDRLRNGGGVRRGVRRRRDVAVVAEHRRRHPAGSTCSWTWRRGRPPRRTTTCCRRSSSRHSFYIATLDMRTARSSSLLA